MTKYQNLSNPELLEQVDRAGPTLPAELIQTLLARRIELRNEIIARFAEAIDDNWEDNDDPRWYRAVHYGFLLIAYRERKALPIFATIYSKTDDYDALVEWFETQPAYFGPPAVPVFQEVLKSRTDLEWHYGRGLSIAILKTIAIHFPETRSGIVAFLRSFLPPLDANGRVVLNDEEEIDELWGSIIDALADLRDRESMPQALAMFDADLIDPMETDRQTYLRNLEQAPSTPKTRTFDIFAFYADRALRNATQNM